jgi:hypothetical protein
VQLNAISLWFHEKDFDFVYDHGRDQDCDDAYEQHDFYGHHEYEEMREGYLIAQKRIRVKEIIFACYVSINIFIFHVNVRIIVAPITRQQRD